MSEARVRLGGGDRRFAALCVAVMAVGGAVFVALFSRAFPEASIDFRVTRQEAGDIAARELAARGLDPAGFRQLVTFDHDDTAKVFLERTLGLQKANAAFGASVPIWRWTARFVKPLSKLEYRAHISPDGRLLAFRRIVPEADAAPDPGDGEARRLAEETVRAMYGVEVGALRFIEATTEKRPTRVDRSFVWESNEVRFGDAALRTQVELQGDRVSRCLQFLEVPQRWKEEYKILRSKNEVAGAVATFAFILTAIAAFVVLVERIPRRDVKWRWALAFGGVAAALQLASDLNELPILVFDYDTTQGWGGFLGQVVVGRFGVAVLFGLVVTLFAAAGEPLYRERYPSRHALGRIFSLRGLQSGEFFRGILLGYALAAAFLAYQVVFYIVAERFGAWAPAEVPYTNLLGTKFPWLAVLVMGFMPATSEEFSSRMFSIPFLQRWLSPAWAIVIAATIWGFLHAAYPNQPFWIRGVEVGLAGVVIGAALLRFGIFPLLVWHFAVDAILTSLFLVRSSSTYFVVSGAISAALPLVPLAVSLWLYRKHGGFVSDGEIANAAVGSAPPRQHEPLPEPVAASPALPLSREIALGCALLAVALLVAAKLLPGVDWPEERFRLDRVEARKAADAFLAGLGDDPAAYLGGPVARTVLPALADPSDTGADLVPYTWSTDAERWLAERGGAGLVVARARHVWQVRYVRPLDLHGAWVALDGRTGEVVGFKRTFPDDEAGASLDEPRARAAASAVIDRLRPALGLPAGLAVVSVKAEKKKARGDWRIAFEAPGPDGVPVRVVVELAGDKPALLGVAPKLPEAWVRTHDRWTGVTWTAVALQVLGFGTLVGLVLAELFHLVRTQRVPWARYAALAAVLSIPTLGRVIAFLPHYLQGYRVEITMQLFAVLVAIGSLLGVMLVFGAALLVLALAGSLRPDLTAALRRPREPGRSLLAAACAVLLLGAAAAFQGSLEAAWPTAMGVGEPSRPAGIDTLLPVFELLEKAVVRTLMLAAAAAVLLSVFRTRFTSAPARVSLIAVLALSWLPFGARSWDELLLPLLGSLIAAFAAILAVALLLKDDVMAWALTGTALVALQGGVPLLLLDPPLWKASGALSVLLVLGVAGYVLFRRRE